jgi:ArsR family transcriptional regulator, arsenate/arsenite/antimonite-responsive transcriptional repressor
VLSCHSGAGGHLFRNISKNPLRSHFENIRSKFVTSKLERHAEQLSALGHPVRLKILRFVVQAGPDGAAAGDIQGHVDLPASTLSHHLKRLVDAGVLSTRSEGTFHFYTAQYGVLRGLTEYLWEDCCKRGTSRCC